MWKKVISMPLSSSVQVQFSVFEHAMVKSAHLHILETTNTLGFSHILVPKQVSNKNKHVLCSSSA